MGCRLDSGLFITEICDYFLGNKLFVVGWTGLLATWERGMKKTTSQSSSEGTLVQSFTKIICGWVDVLVNSHTLPHHK